MKIDLVGDNPEVRERLMRLIADNVLDAIEVDYEIVEAPSPDNYRRHEQTGRFTVKLRMKTPEAAARIQPVPWAKGSS
jgi:hypothetical protein